MITNPLHNSYYSQTKKYYGKCGKSVLWITKLTIIQSYLIKKLIEISKWIQRWMLLWRTAWQNRLRRWICRNRIPILPIANYQFHLKATSLLNLNPKKSLNHHLVYQSHCPNHHHHLLLFVYYLQLFNYSETDCLNWRQLKFGYWSNQNLQVIFLAHIFLLVHVIN